MNAIIISIGDELMSGQTVDTNSAWLSQQLSAIGVAPIEHITVGDDLAASRDAFDRAARIADVVLVSGGLGPTPDDLSREALAAALGVPLELREEFVEQIEAFFVRLRRPMPERNRVQAMFPVGSTAIENTCGTAPGIRARLHKADVFIMPGVPREMRVMFERDVVPHLRAASGEGVILTETLWTFGQGESTIAGHIADLMERGRNPAVGTTAQDAIIGIRIFAHGSTPQEARQRVESTVAEIRSRLGHLVYGQGSQTLAHAVGELLVARGHTVATAESCTGGLIAQTLTDIPGSSRYVVGGAVVYSNELKTALLGVSASLIAEHGAVSAEVAGEMASQAAERTGADWVVAVTGIAGPDGGTPAKPVGLVYIGLVGPGVREVRELRLGDFMSRQDIRSRTRWIALNMLRLALLGEKF